LRNELAPKPLLVLTKDSLEFFGERLDLTGHPEGQIACLWVLAENANLSVPRKDLIDQANLTLKSLKPIISRLRKQILRPLIERYRLREPGSPLPSEDDAFILSRKKRSSSHLWGSYMLQLDPARVKVVGERPSWMKPAPSR
jgi:hypothetical protein